MSDSERVHPTAAAPAVPVETPEGLAGALGVLALAESASKDPVPETEADKLRREELEHALATSGVAIVKFHRSTLKLSSKAQRTMRLQGSTLSVKDGDAGSSLVSLTKAELLGDGEHRGRLHFGETTVTFAAVGSQWSTKDLVCYFQWRVEAKSPASAGAVVPPGPRPTPPRATNSGGADASRALAATLAAADFALAAGAVAPVVAPLFVVLRKVHSAYEAMTCNKENAASLLWLCEHAARELQDVSDRLQGNEANVRELEHLFLAVKVLCDKYSTENLVGVQRLKAIARGMLGTDIDKKVIEDLKTRLQALLLLLVAKSVLRSGPPAVLFRWEEDVAGLRASVAAVGDKLSGLADRLVSKPSDVSDTDWAVAPVPTGVEDIGQCVDRQREMASLVCALLNPEPSPVAVVGLGGGGKTKIVSAALHRIDVRERYKDGILWLDAKRNTGNDERAMLRLLQTLAKEFWYEIVRRRVKDSQPPENLTDAAAVRYYIESFVRDFQLSCLLVLDNVWEPALVREVATTLGGAGVRLLVTSRDHGVVAAALKDSFTVRIGEMTDIEAVAVLKSRAQLDREDWRDEPGHGVRAVLRVCGRLPLALAMAASQPQMRRVSGDSAWRVLADQLEKEKDLLDLSGREWEGTLEAVVRSSFDAIPKEKQRLYLHFAAVPSGFPADREMLASLWACTDDATLDDHIEYFLARSLLQQRDGAAGGFKPHDLQAEFICSHVEVPKWREEGVKDEARGRQRTYLADLRTLSGFTDAHDLVHGQLGLAALWRHLDEGNEFIESAYKANLLQRRRNGASHAELIYDLHAAGDLLRAMGAFDPAVRWYQEALQLRDPRGDATDAKVATTLNNLAGLLESQGKYNEAEPLYRRAIAIDEKALGPDHPELATGLNNLAKLLRAQGKYDEADPLYRRAIEINEKALGPDHPGLATTLNNLAELLKSQGKYGEATPLHERSLAIREKALGPEHPDVAGSLNNVAGLLKSQGKYDEAEPLYERSLAIRKKPLGPEHPDVAGSLNNLAELLRAQGKYKDAEPLCKRSLTIREKALGPEHPDVAGSLNNLAGLLESQGKYDEAKPLYDRSLAIREKALGPEHPDVAQSLNNLAGLLESQGNYDEAKPLYERVIVIFEASLGPEHPNVAKVLNNLAGLLQAQGKYDEAKPLYERVITILKQVLGPEHPNVATVLNNMAGLLESQGKYNEAEPLYKRSLAIREKALGPEHPAVSTALNNLAGLLSSQGKHGEAEPLYRRAIVIDEKVYGPDHPEVATNLNNLAGLLENQGKYDEAEPLYRRAIVIDEKALGPDHPGLATDLNNLAGLLRAQGKFAEAVQLIERGIGINEKALGDDHPNTITCRSWQGTLLQEMGRLDDALPVLQDIVASRERALGPDHPDVGSDLNNLALLYQKQGKYGEAEPLYQRAIDIGTKSLGPGHPHVEMCRSNLAAFLHFGCVDEKIEVDITRGRVVRWREQNVTLVIPPQLSSATTRAKPLLSVELVEDTDSRILSYVVSASPTTFDSRAPAKLYFDIEPVSEDARALISVEHLLNCVQPVHWPSDSGEGEPQYVSKEGYRIMKRKAIPVDMWAVEVDVFCFSRWAVVCKHDPPPPQQFCFLRADSFRGIFLCSHWALQAGAAPPAGGLWRVHIPLHSTTSARGARAMGLNVLGSGASYQAPTGRVVEHVVTGIAHHKEVRSGPEEMLELPDNTACYLCVLRPENEVRPELELHEITWRILAAEPLYTNGLYVIPSIVPGMGLKRMEGNLHEVTKAQLRSSAFTVS